MDSYFTLDALRLPYSVLQKQEFGWLLSLRKFLQWNIVATEGINGFTKIDSISIKDVPQPLQEEFSRKIMIATDYGYLILKIGKIDTIGNLLQFTALLVNESRDTVWEIGSASIHINGKVVTKWIDGLRTDIDEEQSILTLRSYKDFNFLYPKNYKSYYHPNDFPTPKLLSNHINCYSKYEKYRISKIPDDNIESYLENKMAIDLGVTHFG
ncbi:hypothetical protein [Armatimonas sp.]|uniref:hypothetical protein n=1 Tax=Armatimonas sp. TaxID=1872638 RepID=UPI00286B4EF0|nr:hypothetical protein [Armatimonas sp.]